MAVSNDVIQKLNIPENTPVQQTGAVATAAAPVDVTAQSSNDTVTTGNSQNAQTSAKRSAEQLYQAIQALCTSNGIDFNEVKKMGLLSSVSGKSEEYLLNEAEDAEIKKLVKLIEETIAAMKEDGIELTAENLEKQARGYRIVTENGWDSIDSFRNANNKNSKYSVTGKNNESVNQRLDRFGIKVNGKKFSELTTPEERAQGLKQYFKIYFEQKINDGNKPEDIINLQKTDFVKLLFNSNDEERAILKEAIPYLAGENRLDGLVALIDSFDTQEARTNCANSMDHKYMESMRVPDENFHTAASAEDIRDMVAYATKYKDAAHITEYHNEAEKARAEFFTEENIAKLEAIKTKVENDEELTEEEKALLADAEFHTADAAGEIVGVGNNVVISEDSKNEILETLNTDAYKNPNYREVLNQVNKYIEKHPEYLTMTKEEFINKMNEITNGNFDKVINNSSEPLKAPEVKTETPSTTTTKNQPQLTAEDIEARRANITSMNEQLQSQSSENNTNHQTNTPSNKKKYSLNVYEKYGEKGIKAYIKAYGENDFINNAIKNGNKLAQNIAERIYTKKDNASQEQQATNTLSFKVGSTLLNWMSDTAFSNINQMANGALTKLHDSMQKEKEEEKTRLV